MILPPKKRASRILNLMKSLFAPLNTVKTQFYDHYNEIKYNLQFNGQIIYLEHILNDKFDNTLRRIYIEDAENAPSTFLFNNSEGNEETFLFNNFESEPPVYFYNLQELNLQVDFIVFVPIGFIYNADQLKNIVNKYKHSATRYKIEEI